MNRQITNENEYLKLYPVTNDIMTGIIEEYGIDISFYDFSSFQVWYDGDIEFNDIYYGHKKNENVAMLISISIHEVEIRLEGFIISLD